jgi:hypothetical protein
MEQKIRESIRRLSEIKPSEIDAGTWLKVTNWLFPRIIAYMDGYREDEKKEEKVPDSE